ncbi:MAG: hypothetical protein IPK21_23085 [Haliscomenobacter sp.]|nr:hypothetical protein [Haliscomenobacter sp.]
MRLPIFLAFFLGLGFVSGAQTLSGQNELSVNGFRNPSIGLEFRRNQVSVHAGYYLTNFQPNTTTRFLKAGVSFWFLPVGDRAVPSSFYLGASYLRGLSREYEDQSAAALEGGFRWMIWKGLNLRIGAIALGAKGQTLKINPTPGISYSFTL